MNIIKLDVGGKLFKIGKDLLLSKSKYFEDLFEDTTVSELDSSEEIYVDRSPHIFKHVLAYIRDSTYKYPEKYLNELDYFGVSFSKIEPQSTEVKKYCSYCEYECQELFCSTECAKMKPCIYCNEWKDRSELRLGYCKNCQF
jgi:hypothetical protein